MRLEFLGAAHTVTGSCFLLELDEKKYLIDCGMFQGAKRIRERNYAAPTYNPAEIEAVFLTHAHIDHCGLLPRLCKNGFQGAIYATKATCELAQIMLPDSAQIQESDAELQNRKGMRSGAVPVQPLYTMDDAMDALRHFVPQAYGQRLGITEHLAIVFHDAGHILGSSILEIETVEGGEAKRLVFSGDIGQPKQPIIKDPSVITGADYLVIESTYGDRLHQDYDKESALAEIVNDTIDRGGNLVIPSFAVGRTQTLLYYFHRLCREGRIDSDIPIIIDSPMAIAATRVFAQNTQEFDDESTEFIAKHGLPEMPQLRLCESAEESRALNSSEGSAIIISASGMADAGRILHHLKHNLWRPESTVLFVGYQAEGSMGRRLVDGIKRVRIMGEEIVVRAKVQMLDGFSAHADANQLLAWIAEVKEPKPKKIFIVHGEAQAQEALKERIENELGLDAYIPFQGDIARIEGKHCEIQPSNIPSISVEKEMEEFLRTVDSTYRAQRRRLLQLVIKNPELMEPIIKSVQKGWNYMKKIFSVYG